MFFEVKNLGHNSTYKAMHIHLNSLKGVHSISVVKCLKSKMAIVESCGALYCAYNIAIGV